jgi:uncharacterized repeat protein (TIGR03803 family)
MVVDASGNLYGTTVMGGSNNDGVVYEVAKGSGSITVLATFNGNNGSAPSGGLITDAFGDLYGTTEHGGADNEGTIFELAKGSSSITTLESFNGTNGAGPASGLLNVSGTLYGTTFSGFGANSNGTLFEFTTVWTGGASDANWTDAANWGGAAPVPIVSLNFAGSSQLNPNNDYPAYTPFPGIIFDAAAGAFALAGNAIDLGGDIVNNSVNPQTINLGLVLTNNVNLNAAAGNLVISKPISGNFSVNVEGAGTVTLGAANNYSSGTFVSDGGTLVVAAAGALPAGGALTVGGATPAEMQLATSQKTFTVSSLTILNGTLDIANNTLMVDYGSFADPAAMIRSYLVSGHNAAGVAWAGTGITSSVAAANPAMYSIGYADGNNPADAANTGIPAGDLEITSTIAGDVNLDGSVGLSDLVIVASDFGMNGADWAEGDVNYDGNVDLSDLVIVASNFGASFSAVSTANFSSSFAAEWQLALAEARGADAQLPEPIGLSAITAFFLLPRKRNASTNRHESFRIQK